MLKSLDRLTFGRKITAGFAGMLLLCLMVGWVAWNGIRSTTDSKDRIVTGPARALMEAERLNFLVSDKVVQARGFAITRKAEQLAEMAEARAELLHGVERLRKLLPDSEGQALLDRAVAAERQHQEAWEQVVARVRAGAGNDEIAELFFTSTRPRQLALSAALRDISQHEEQAMTLAIQASNARAAQVSAVTFGLMALAAALASVLAIYITRSLNRQIGSAVQHVQSSATELQASAGEQATGSKEQASAVTEIAMTIKELLATSRQIAESSQRVAQIAQETAEAAQRGDGTVAKGHDAIATIQRQTDQVVAQVLDLGKRSQQIGGVVDIITELAEQTNILAINATIEAAGAGESGRRFSVVADEIRKLADRVGSSAKDIRGIIEQIRDSVNTTVMATEGGSKAVEAGTRQFSEIAGAFRSIVDSVLAATDAAREIELSTKQQLTAIEQVNSAIGNVAQAVHELEASSTQTLQTSSQLATLSTELSSMVRSGERRAA